MTLPVACNLGTLTTEQRRREQEILAKFRAAQLPASAIDGGYRFDVPCGPADLAELGEFVALERLCCPFLSFRLSIGAALAPVFLEIVGEGRAVEAFIRATFVELR